MDRKGQIAKFVDEMYANLNEFLCEVVDDVHFMIHQFRMVKKASHVYLYGSNSTNLCYLNKIKWNKIEKEKNYWTSSFLLKRLWFWHEEKEKHEKKIIYWFMKIEIFVIAKWNCPNDCQALFSSHNRFSIFKCCTNTASFISFNLIM